MKMRTTVLALGFAALAAAACSKSESGQPSGTGEAAKPTTGAVATNTTGGGGAVDMDKAKAMYQERCAACHGASGKGDGPGAAALTPKPRDYTDKAWQSSVTDEQIKKVITMGGAAVGKSPIMPASPDLDAKPEIVEGLVKVVRGFGG